MPKAAYLLRSGIRAIAAEFISTMLLVMLGCMSCITDKGDADVPKLLQVAIAFGTIVMFNVQIFGHVSGAHMNPAVTLAAVLYGKTPAALGAIFAAVQVLGALVGFGGTLLLTYNTESNGGFRNDMCLTVPSNTISGIQATAIEFFITLILILLCCAVWDPVNAKNIDSVPIKFGLTVASLCLATGSYTGASLNPARSFGPALWNGKWTKHYVYWVGPLLAAVVGVFMYKLVLASGVDKGVDACGGELEREEGVEEVPLARRLKEAAADGTA